MNRRWLRYGPWVLALVGGLLAAPGWRELPSGLPVQAGSESGEGGVQSRGTESVMPSPDSPIDGTRACEGDVAEYRELVAISQQAATLTGTLALVGAGERHVQAEWAAHEIHLLANQATGLQAGDALAGVLRDLAAGLEGYSQAGLAPLTDIQDASNRNAQLRTELQSYITRCIGGYE